MTLDERELKRSAAYREGKHKLKSIRWMLFFVVAVQTLVTVAASLVSSFFEVPPPVYLEMLIIELFAYLIPISLYAKENRLLTMREARERFGLKGCDKRLLLWVVLAGIGCQFIMLILNLPVNFLLEKSDGYIPTTPWELAMAILVLACVPAVFEEFLLRGIVYGVMADYNSRAAMIFTTIMFALMHFNPAGLVGYLFFGVVLVVLLRRTGSLYACMLFHLVNHLAALLLSYFSYALIDMPMMTVNLFVWGVIAAGIGFIVLSVLTKKPRPVLRMKTSEFLGQSFINLPILLCIASILGVLILQG